MNEGDVVLTPLPQANGRTKNRPCIALRRMPGFGDWLVCGVSTQLRQAVLGFDEPLRAEDADFVGSGLKAPSIIRLAFLGMVPEERLLGAIGALAPERHRRLLRRLSAYLNAEHG